MLRLFTIVIILTVILGTRLYFDLQKDPTYVPGDIVNLSGIIWDDPKQLGRIQRVKFEDITLIVPEFPVYSYGDSLAVQGMITENTFTSKAGSSVTELVIESAEIKIVQSPGYIRAAVWMRERVISTFNSLLPVNESALLLGITLGVRSEFSKELLDTFTQTGILHVVAASGSNVAIVAGVILFTLNHFIRRRLAVVITVLAVMWYAVLAGFDPAIVRASLMALITLSAQLLGRQQLSYFVLVLTIWIMLMVSPSLIKNVGFQLSATATAGIIILKPYLDRLVAKLGFFKDDVATTLSAQWGSLPILIGTFGSFAPMSVLVNVLVLWAVPIIMIIGIVGSVGALIHPYLAAPFVYAAYPFTVFFLTTVNIAEYVVFPLTIDRYSSFLTVSYYLISLSIIMHLKLKYETK